MNALAKLVYEQIRERAPFDEETFLRMTEDWLFEPIGEMGVLMHKDGIAHIAIRPEFRGRWASRSRIKSLLEKAAKDGKVYTQIYQGDDFRESFALRLGFQRLNHEQPSLYGMQL